MAIKTQPYRIFMSYIAEEWRSRKDADSICFSEFEARLIQWGKQYGARGVGEVLLQQGTALLHGGWSDNLAIVAYGVFGNTRYVAVAPTRIPKDDGPWFNHIKVVEHEWNAQLVDVK